MTNKTARSVTEYLAALPDDRRLALEKVRRVILKHLPRGFEEGMQYGMIGYYVPHTLYPPGYHCDPQQPLPFAGLASQKNHMAVYLCHLYMEPGLKDWFDAEYRRSGKKLDAGKACIRFKKLEDLPLELIGEAVAKAPVKEFIAGYEWILAMRSKKPASRSSRQKTTARKVVRKAPRSTSIRKKKAAARR
ncbi:MAG: hypothetical protein HJJLKODD_02084 [Phycisphaerae bacterium]|nr:hypothetical protein [Phycisphaerae bacterium]